MEKCRSVISLAAREGAEAEIFLLKKDLKSVRVVGNEIVESQNKIWSNGEQFFIGIARFGKVF